MEARVLLVHTRLSTFRSSLLFLLLRLSRIAVAVDEVVQAGVAVALLLLVAAALVVVAEVQLASDGAMPLPHTSLFAT